MRTKNCIYLGAVVIGAWIGCAFGADDGFAWGCTISWLYAVLCPWMDVQGVSEDG